jgi:hypothetical protein
MAPSSHGPLAGIRVVELAGDMRADVGKPWREIPRG